MLQIQVNRSAGTFGQVDVLWALRSQTPVSVADYLSPASGKVSFAPQQNVAFIHLATKQDEIASEAKEFILELTSASNDATLRITAEGMLIHAKRCLND